MPQCLFLPMPATLIDTRAGHYHPVPEEVVQQAEEGELESTMAAWARKLGIIEEPHQMQVMSLGF